MKVFTLFLFLLPTLIFSQYEPKTPNNGIYLLESEEQLYASVLGGCKTQKNGLFMLTFGAVSAERIPFLLSSTSIQKVQKPIFRFEFENDIIEDPYNSYFDRAFRQATSPKEFLLIKLEPKPRKNRRHLLKEKSGWKTKIATNTIEFKFEKEEEGIFIVTPAKSLEPGEYCFVHQDILTAHEFSDFMFYDFSVE